MKTIKLYLTQIGHALIGKAGQKETWFWNRIEDLEHELDSAEKTLQKARLNATKKTVKKVVGKKITK
jgi:hypothetical protein